MQNGVEPDESQELEKGTLTATEQQQAISTTLLLLKLKSLQTFENSNAYKNIDHEMPKILLA